MSARRRGSSAASRARTVAGRPLPGALSSATIASVSEASLITARCASGRLAERAFATLHLAVPDPFQRPADQVQQRVVLPQAHPERDRQHGAADDQARAQLFEVLDEAEAIFVADRANRGGHAS